MRVIFFIFLCIESVLCFSNGEKSFGYDEFKLCFEDFNSNQKNERLIPNNSFTAFLYSSMPNQSFYGVEKLEQVNGCDFFVLKQLIDDEIEVIDNKIYLIYKDKKMVGKYDVYDSSRLLEAYIEGEGGVIDQSYKIEKDSTITVSYNKSDCCISTGFDTPIEHRNKVSYYINEEGELQVRDVLNVSFSSNFFDLAYIQKKSVDSGFQFPDENEPYDLVVSNFIDVFPIYQRGIRLLFYIKRYNSHLLPCFVTWDESKKMIDEYMIENTSIKRKSNAIFCDSLFKQSIKISVGKKIIFINSDGFFMNR